MLHARAGMYRLTPPAVARRAPRLTCPRYGSPTPLFPALTLSLSLTPPGPVPSPKPGPRHRPPPTPPLPCAAVKGGGADPPAPPQLRLYNPLIGTSQLRAQPTELRPGFDWQWLSATCRFHYASRVLPPMGTARAKINCLRQLAKKQLFSLPGNDHEYRCEMTSGLWERHRPASGNPPEGSLTAPGNSSDLGRKPPSGLGSQTMMLSRMLAGHRPLASTVARRATR